MRRFIAALALLLLLATLALGAAKDAVCRVNSHGASCTVIWTGQGRSILLGCAHAFEGRDRDKRITIQAPALQGGQSAAGGIRLVKIDYRLDLSLVELPAGPLPYVAPVAPRGFRPGRCISAGFDSMRLPGTVAAVDLLDTGPAWTHTRQIPWPGRSGGALLDADTGWLIGVVHGFECSPLGKPRPGDRGIYVSHAAVLQFLGPGWPQPAARQPPADVYRPGPYDRPGYPQGTVPYVQPGPYTPPGTAPYIQVPPPGYRPGPAPRPYCPT